MTSPVCSADSNAQQDESGNLIDANSMGCSHAIPGQELLAQYAEVTKSLSAIRELQLESMRVIVDKMKNSVAMAECVRSALAPAYELARSVSESAAKIVSEIDFSGLRTAILPLITQASYINILIRTNWPLYLINDQEMLDEVLALDASSDVQTLSEEIAGIARERLGSEWLNELKARWGSHDELTQGEREILECALLHYESCDYASCVSMLMCLFCGLLNKYYGEPVKLQAHEAEVFDYFASRHGINAAAGEGKPRPLKAAKDKIVVLILRSEGGYFVWQAAGGYIVDVVLTNRMDEDIALHNPLRNKICHGIQTYYGTWEHAVKSILVTDILIRLGDMTLAGREQREECEVAV